MPLVSVIIPVKNRLELLRETLVSVMGQTFPDWEVIIVDDDSNDGINGLVQSIARDENRVRYVCRDKRPSTASTCRNIGVSVARGKYVIFLDSDDVLAPHCLARRVEVMEEHPELDFAVFQTWIFHTTPGDTKFFWNVFTSENDADRILRTDPPWQTVGPIWRRTSLARLGAWNERARSWQDWEFHIRAVLAGCKYLLSPEADAYYRFEAPGSISRSSGLKRQVVNRVRLFKNIVLFIKACNAMTAYRRRVLAVLFYHHAFSSNLRFRHGLAIWREGRRLELVSFPQFLVVLLCQIWVGISRKIARFLEEQYPDYHRVGPNSRWSATCPAIPHLGQFKIANKT